MKVIFLDHDGVICLSDQWGGRYKKKGFDSNPETPLDIRMDNFDTKSVKILNKINNWIPTSTIAPALFYYFTSM